MAEQEQTTISDLLKRIEWFIHTDDYVHKKRDLDNIVKEMQAVKKFKYSDSKQKPTVHDQLGPKKSYTPSYDYTPLKFPVQMLFNKWSL